MAATAEEHLEFAANEVLFVGGELSRLLTQKRGLRRALIKELIERLNNARGSLETVIR